MNSDLALFLQLPLGINRSADAEVSKLCPTMTLFVLATEILAAFLARPPYIRGWLGTRWWISIIFPYYCILLNLRHHDRT